MPHTTHPGVLVSPLRLGLRVRGLDRAILRDRVKILPLCAILTLGAYRLRGRKPRKTWKIALAGRLQQVCQPPVAPDAAGTGQEINAMCLRPGCESPSHGQSRFCLVHKRENRAKRNATRMENLHACWTDARNGVIHAGNKQLGAIVMPVGLGESHDLAVTCSGGVFTARCATRGGAQRWADTLFARACAWEFATSPAPKPVREKKPRVTIAALLERIAALEAAAK